MNVFEAMHKLADRIKWSPPKRAADELEMPIHANGEYLTVSEFMDRYGPSESEERSFDQDTEDLRHG